MCLIMFHKHITFYLCRAFLPICGLHLFSFIQKNIITDNHFAFCEPWLPAGVREIRFLSFSPSCTHTVCQSQIPNALRRVEWAQLYWVIFQLAQCRWKALCQCYLFQGPNLPFILSKTLKNEHLEWIQFCRSPDGLRQMVKIQVKCTWFVEDSVKLLS